MHNIVLKNVFLCPKEVKTLDHIMDGNGFLIVPIHLNVKLCVLILIN